MNYSLIDIEKWERASVFTRFIGDLRCVMSLTAEVDITKFLNFVRKNNLKFYPSFMWAVTKIVNSHDEFKYGWNDEGKLVLYDVINPYYADFDEQTQKFKKMVINFSDDLFEFNNYYLKNKKIYEKLSGFDFKEVPKNVFDVSCLPWVKYSAFDMHVFDEGKYLAPVVTWGKYVSQNDKIIIPLTMNIHHAVADGFHLCRFFTEIQNLLNSF